MAKKIKASQSDFYGAYYSTQKESKFLFYFSSN